MPLARLVYWNECDPEKKIEQDEISKVQIPPELRNALLPFNAFDRPSCTWRNVERREKKKK
jgi:hypothetical protein